MLRRLALVLSLGTALTLGIAYSQKPTESQGEEAFLSFEYPPGGVSTVIVGQLVKDRFFLPVTDIFQALGVNFRASIEGAVVRGFFVTEDAPYEIDSKSLKASLKDQVLRLTKDDFLLTGPVLYLAADVYQKLFGLRFSVDISRLLLSLETSVYLPVVAQRDRERNRQFLETIAPGLPQYPLMYPRVPHLFNGLLLDYSLTAVSSSGKQSYAYDLRAGGELLYGDLQVGAQGNDEPGYPITSTWDFRWRRAFERRRYLTQVSLGDLYASGVQQYQFRGIQISNDPLQPRELYQTYLIEQTTLPDWTVELYLNEQLVGTTRADAQGRYRFSIPLTYGTTEYTVRLYGPTGEQRSQRHRLQIPYTLLPRGEVIYTLNAGKTTLQGDRILQGSVATGLTKSLTWNVGFENVRDTLSNLAVASTGMTVRAGENYIIGLQATPSLLYRAEINAVYPSQTSFTSSFALYGRNPFYNPSEKLRDLQGLLSIPLRTPSASYYLQLSGSRSDFDTGVLDQAAIGATISTGTTTSTLGFQRTRNQSGSGTEIVRPLAQGSILHLVSLDQLRSSILSTALIGLSAGYDLHQNTWDNIRADFSASIFRNGRLQVSLRRDFIVSTSSLSAQFVYEFDGTRSTTAAVFRDSPTYTQNLRGSVFVNRALTYRRFFNREWVGKSGVRFRSFLDYNGNAVLDPGEKVISGVAVNLSRAFSVQQTTPTSIYAWELLPYNLFRAEVNDLALENAVWVPRQRTFSFVTEPNVLKAIDIPFDVVGTIEGSVLKETPSGMQPVPGLKVQVARINGTFRKTVSVFQDGSLYFIGIPPGWYTATVDSTQLQILGLQSEPGIIPFVIRSTKEGDYVSNLNFILREGVGKKH